MIYEQFIATKGYSADLQRCIEDTVEKLLANKTGFDFEGTVGQRPGMLLGKIQSGKTRAFIGIMALAFDKGYDVCVVFTKGTNALATQTIRRFESDFDSFINDDEVKVYDIMSVPNLTPYIKGQKLIFVVKKETRNIDRLTKLLYDNIDLTEKRVLFIDDEADTAGIGFHRDRHAEDGIELNVIASKINSVRAGFSNNYSFLQVTATPYALYLQPEGEIQLNNCVFHPIKPAFTSLVPIHDAYIGGKQYFEESLDANSIYSKLYIGVGLEELKALGKQDRRYIANILTTNNLHCFRESIINYLVGGSIRLLQEQKLGKNYKSSFIIHTETAIKKHEWQMQLFKALYEKLQSIAQNGDATEMDKLISDSYNNIAASVKINEDYLPEYDCVKSLVCEAVRKGRIGYNVVNSDEDIVTLLNKDGELRLDNPFNIFIGGQILDRGITIPKLIGFFYGRNPKRMQMNTVLQHCRMYGARDRKDMAVTRFYTTERIYQAMKKIHDFDSALRDAFERGINGDDDSIVFIERDQDGRIIPCSPNQIMLSETNVIKPYARFLPYGFQTRARTHIQETVQKIDKMLPADAFQKNSEPQLIDVETVNSIIDLIYKTFTDHLGIDNETLKSIISRLQDNITSNTLKGKIYCYVRTGRNVSRTKADGSTFSDAPEDGQTDSKIAKQFAQETACLIMLKQNGKKENGWQDAEFWWPVLISPANAKTAIFASRNSN